MLEKWVVVFFELAISFEIVITITFWFALFPMIVKTGRLDLPMNITVHALPLILLIIDFVLNRVPFVLRHIVIAIFVILIYGIMNMAITLITGHPIYPILDY